MTPQRTALMAAVDALPEEGGPVVIGRKTLAAAGLEGDELAAEAFVRHFSQWARAYARTVPDVAEGELEATDFNDYYKLVMSRVQYI